jgi:hypothetical protein
LIAVHNPKTSTILWQREHILFGYLMVRGSKIHDYSFWTTNTSGPRSIFWSSILQVRRNSAPILFTRSMQATLQFGQLHGA